MGSGAYISMPLMFDDTLASSIVVIDDDEIEMPIVALYNGKSILAPNITTLSGYTASVSFTGNIASSEDGYLVTGDGTILITVS